MEQNNIEKLIDCPKSGGKFCYETEPYPGTKVWMSLSSGFWTNSLMTKGSDFYNEQTINLPSLYVDIEWEDPNTKLIWLPQTINIPNVGMVFVNGTDSTNWGWSAVKSIQVGKDEKKKFPIKGQKGKYQTQKMDMTNMMNFGQDEFMNCLAYLGIFNK